ncbi:MAG: hypothetical protein PHT99_03180 [Methanoregula sp.]|nr:hypothetical protein [Methanoregula sp.]
MGEKKKKEASQNRWKKVLFVIAAVLFVFVMVISSMGSQWITGLAPIKPGDTVVLDYTLYDAAGTPLLTTDSVLYEQMYSKGGSILYAKQLTMTANQSLKTAIYPIPVYIAENGGNYEEFALYNPEYNAISSALVGMRTNEKKKVSLTSGISMSKLFSSESLMAGNVNMSTLAVGDILAMGVSESSNATASNNSVTYIRLAEVTRITDSGAVIDFGYPSAEITVSSFKST